MSDTTVEDTPVEADLQEEDTPVDTPVDTVSLPRLADVDVADVDAGSGDGEVGPLILPGYWVILGPNSDVESRFEGHPAAVIESPWASAPIGTPDQVIAGYTFDPAKKFLVQTRDDANVTFEVTQDAFLKVAETRAALGR